MLLACYLDTKTIIIAIANVVVIRQQQKKNVYLAVAVQGADYNNTKQKINL